MTPPFKPSEIMKATEDFIRALEHKSSRDVIDKHMGSDEEIRIKYLFLCQMLASTTSIIDRMEMNTRFIAMLARTGMGGENEG